MRTVTTTSDTPSKAAKKQQDIPRYFAIICITLLSIAVRVININYNTLFLDEAIYVTIGHEALNQIYVQGATSWMFGSYLYPISSALADTFGVTGIRLWSVSLNVMAIVSVYHASRQMMDSTVGLLATFLFAFHGLSISLAQTAVYDGMSVAFLAMAFATGVNAVSNEPGQRANLYWVGMGIFFTLSVMAKYISLIYAPALFGLLYAYRLRRDNSLLQFIVSGEWVYALVPFILVFGTYVSANFSDLQLVFSGQYASQQLPRGFIFNEVMRQLGIISLLAIGGMYVFSTKYYRQLKLRTPWGRATYWCLSTLIGLSFWSLPIYHIYSANARALNKHMVFSLIFLAPFAAYGIVHIARPSAPSGRLASPSNGVMRGTAVSTLLVVFLTMSWFTMQQHDRFQYSWPSANKVIAFLEEQPITVDSRILSSAAAIYEYYLAMPPEETRMIWTNVQLFGMDGADTIQAAIETCQFEMIITDNYYAPDYDSIILESLGANPQYVQVLTDKQILADGNEITTRIYELQEEGKCPEEGQSFTRSVPSNNLSGTLNQPTGGYPPNLSIRNNMGR